ARLVPGPAAGPRHDEQRHRQGGEDRRAVLRPEGLDLLELLLFLQVVCHCRPRPPVRQSSPSSSSATVSTSRSTGTDCCAPLSGAPGCPCISAPARRRFTPTSPRASSSSPITRAIRAPLASARRNCDLKLPPPACISTSKPAERS